MELYHPVIRIGIAADMMVTFQYSNRKELKTAESSGLQQHIVWQCMGETPRNIDYNQSAMAEGRSTRFVVICSSSDADNWKCAPLVLYMYWSFKILFLVRFSHTLFLIGQHTLLTANCR